MTWTYDPNLASDLAKVRFLIGDTDTTDQQYSDEELNATLTITGSVNAAAVRSVRGLVAKYARQADKWVGDLKILASQKHKAYLTLLEELEGLGDDTAVGSRTHQQPFAGGISIMGKESLELDTDWPTPSFNRGMHDNED